MRAAVACGFCRKRKVPYTDFIMLLKLLRDGCTQDRTRTKTSTLCGGVLTCYQIRCAGWDSVESGGRCLNCQRTGTTCVLNFPSTQGQIFRPTPVLHNGVQRTSVGPDVNPLLNSPCFPLLGVHDQPLGLVSKEQRSPPNAPGRIAVSRLDIVVL